jgi:predicted nucleotidyltransferase
MKKEQIITFLKENKQYFEQEFGVVRMGLFGSFVRGNEREDSDIDIAVEMRDERIFRNFFNLERYLKEHLKREIDLGIEGTLKPAVKKRVLEEIVYV